MKNLNKIAFSALIALSATSVWAKEQCINNSATTELKAKLNQFSASIASSSTLSKEADEYIKSLEKAIKKYQYQLSNENDKKGYDTDVYCQIALTQTFVDELDKLVKGIGKTQDIVAEISQKQQIIEEGIKLVQSLEAAPPTEYPEACANKKPDQFELLENGFIDYSNNKLSYFNAKHTDGILLSKDAGIIGTVTHMPVIGRTTEDRVQDAWYDKSSNRIMCVSTPKKVPSGSVDPLKKLQAPKK